jgi:hypothetical protein
MQAVGGLDHPNIVRAMDAGEIDGNHYLVMELVEGEDLSAISHLHGPLKVADACELVRQAAIGLQEAHEHGMVHRDIKPSNLMLAKVGRGKKPPTVKILDMGLALLGEAHSAQQRELTGTGQMMGTLDYMAPEQGMDSHEVDIRADIYSLGATLYKLLCGEAPFPSSKYDTPVKLMMALATEQVPSIATKRDDLPAELVSIVDRMLAKQPEHRFATPQEVADALAPLCEDASLAALLALNEDVAASVEIDQSAAPTHDHVSSGSHDTAPTIDLPSSHHAPHHDQPEGASPRFQHEKQRHEKPWASARRLMGNRRIIAVAAALGGVVMLGIITLLFQTKDGTIVVEIDDPDGLIEVKVVGQDIVINDKQREGESITLQPGKHQLHVSRGDLSFKTDEFMLKRDQRIALRVKFSSGQVQVNQNGKGIIGQSQPAPTATQFALDLSKGPAGVSLPAAYQKTEPFTVEMWVTLYETKSDRQVERIWSLSDDVTLSRSNGRVLTFTAYHGSGSYTAVRAAYEIELGKRSHLACVSDGKGLSIFLDGRLLDHKELKGEIRRAEKPMLSVLGNLKPLPAETHAYFNGNIDEFRFSNSARYTTSFSPADRFESDDQTVVLYHFDEGTGDIVRDTSGNGHNGKLVGGAKWVAIPRSATPTNGHALEFAHNARMEVPSF